ncbi:Cobyric acid synthase [Candidatus Nitrospira nitrosa]|uniref:Cobyric acid synthase n=1 Tax=Candidatus Nitrospira nitrosa TaxID=1742972 RepID=A0A0S4LP26_9BACT|nr:cobyric acid synthase [Candidatus Nitrospira nitrosa]CUS36834.1 Cobyric acid synthase [Candidatus Nitrospira nitrosa]
MTARALAVLGTGSDVGKSLITAGICRVLHRAGMRVAPFKAQNMSLNSFVTPEGGEIGRAQALQAEACGIVPHVDMNPILLKPESDNRSQVIVQGSVWSAQEASTYYEQRPQLWSIVQDSYSRLASQYEVVMIEGAGSAAEMNLRERDLVNWPVVRLANARVLLVADIDRGGVFAQVLGTLDLLEPDERAMVCGVVINKFRGDAKLFADGVTFLESHSGIPVLGVVPFLRDLMLDQEDSLDREACRQTEFSSERINIAVILLPHMSNFTDFNVLAAEGDVALQYVAAPTALDGADIVIIPGSKTTQADLSFVLAQGYAPALVQHVGRHRELVGICGGYQMLGRSISDPYMVEQGGSSSGLGYLDIKTELRKKKCTTQVEANAAEALVQERSLVRGYQVHMGYTVRMQEHPCFSMQNAGTPMGGGHSPTATAYTDDGAIREDGLVWGTYIHGVFDEPQFRRAWLNRARVRKGLPPLGIHTSLSVTARLRGELDRWTDHLSQFLDLSGLLSWLPPRRMISK